MPIHAYILSVDIRSYSSLFVAYFLECIELKLFIIHTWERHILWGSITFNSPLELIDYFFMSWNVWMIFMNIWYTWFFVYWMLSTPFLFSEFIENCVNLFVYLCVFLCLFPFVVSLSWCLSNCSLICVLILPKSILMNHYFLLFTYLSPPDVIVELCLII